MTDRDEKIGDPTMRPNVGLVHPTLQMKRRCAELEAENDDLRSLVARLAAAGETLAEQLTRLDNLGHLNEDVSCLSCPPRRALQAWRLLAEGRY